MLSVFMTRKETEQFILRRLISVMNRDKRINALIWGFVALISLWLNMGLQSMRDDFIFAQALERYGSLFGWARVYGTTWGGRIIPHGLLILLLQLPNIVFIVLNSGMIILSIYLFTSIFAPKEIRFPSVAGAVMTAALCLLKITKQWEITTVILWKCASVLYLWSIAGFLLAIRPLVLSVRGENIKRSEWALAYLGGIYASSFEQMAAFLMVFMLLFTAYNWFIEGKRSVKCFVLSVIISVFSLFFANLPGNSVRTVAEIIRWKQNYGMFSLFDRIIIGVCVCLTFIRDHAVPLMFVSSVFLLILIWKRRPLCKLLRILAFEPALYYSLTMFSRVGKSETIHRLLGIDFSLFEKHFFNILNADSIYYKYPCSVLPTFVAVFSLVTFGSLLFLASGEKEYDLIKPMFFFGGCGTIILIGLSPTFIASGIRVCFIAVVFLTFVTIMLAWDLKPGEKLN